LVEQISFKYQDADRMTTTKKYDGLNRLLSIESRTDAGVVSSHAYDYNDASQRTKATLAGGSHWDYSYDPLGQLTSGHHLGRNGTPLPGEQFDYAYDDIGNRKRASGGLDSVGAPNGPSEYDANALNQYIGRAEKGSGGKEAPVISQEGFAYDPDGNLTQDGQWAYTWNGENRLVGMESLGAVAGGKQRRLVFAYDWRGRRLRKQVIDGKADHWSLASDLCFLYDGWNLIAELDATTVGLRTSPSAGRTYTWGLDVSSTPQGAGGVGGLLAVQSIQSGAPRFFAAYDGNGNVTALATIDDGSRTATYEYDPFGAPIHPGPATQDKNPLRFSSKYYD
jgi:YD repeat-containing protein